MTTPNPSAPPPSSSPTTSPTEKEKKTTTAASKPLDAAQLQQLYNWNGLGLSANVSLDHQHLGSHASLIEYRGCHLSIVSPHAA